jgi:hypothetical protein
LAAVDADAMVVLATRAALPRRCMVDSTEVSGDSGEALAVFMGLIVANPGPVCATLPA